MSTWAMLTAAALAGVDVGWQPLDNGGFEYIIQIPPDQVQSLLDGQDITSELPPLVRGIRSYRVTVGTNSLPRSGAPPLPVPPTPEDQPVDQAPEETTNDAPPDPVADATPPPALPERLDPDKVAHANRITDPEQDQTEEPAEQHATGYRSHDDQGHADDEPEGRPPASADAGNQEVRSVPDPWGDPAEETPQPTRPWWPLTLALMGLFGSVGLNGYLGWIFFELRSRHRRLVVSRIQDAAFDGA